MIAKCAGAAVIVALLAWCLAGVPSAELAQTLRKRGMHLAEFGNEGYTIAFPPEDKPVVAYQDQKSDYLVSTVAPSGRSLFALRRLFDGRTPPRDLLVRRTLGDHEAPEESISSAFKIIQDFAFSPSERFAVIGGRLGGDDAGRKETDGIFLWDRGRGTITYLAPYLVGLAQNGLGGAEIRSLNVNDRADLVVYEENGTVVKFSAANGALSVAERQPGEFPVLMPSGDAYLYCHDSQLVWSDGKTKRTLMHIPKILGGVRISPDGQFVAFGRRVTPIKELASQLRICELSSRTCVDGPTYFEWTAGRATFWIGR